MEWAFVAVLIVQLLVIAYLVTRRSGAASEVSQFPPTTSDAALVASIAELVRQLQHERSQLVDALIARSAGDYNEIARMAQRAENKPYKTREQREIEPWEKAFGERITEAMDNMGDGQPIGLDGNI